MQNSPLLALDAKRPYETLIQLWGRSSDREISSADRAGWIYVFYEGGGVFKVGRTNDLERRIREWENVCPGIRKIWLGAYWTPFANRTEHLVHLALEAQCACRPRFTCTCGRTHIEKFVFFGDPQAVYEGLILSRKSWVLRYLSLKEHKYGVELDLPAAPILSTFKSRIRSFQWLNLALLGIFFGAFTVGSFLALHFFVKEKR